MVVVLECKKGFFIIMKTGTVVVLVIILVLFYTYNQSIKISPLAAAKMVIML